MSINSEDPFSARSSGDRISSEPFSSAKWGDASLPLEGEMPSAESIKTETEDPNSAQAKVRAYLQYDRYDAAMDSEAPELHPKELESKIKKTSKRFLPPLSKTLRIGGVGGLITGMLLGVPGYPLALAGLAGIALSNYLEESKKTKFSEKDSIQNRIENLIGSFERMNLEKYMDLITHPPRAEIKKELKIEVKSLQRIKFELLEAEIKLDHQLDQEEIVQLFEKYVDKQVGNKQYKALMNNYILALNNHYKGMDPEKVAHLVSIVKRSGTEEHRKVIKKMEKHKASTDSKIWESLVAAAKKPAKPRALTEIEDKQRSVFANIINLGKKNKKT